jgi:hypothetical protein
MPLSKQQLGSLLWGIADTGLRGILTPRFSAVRQRLFHIQLSRFMSFVPFCGHQLPFSG